MYSSFLSAISILIPYLSDVNIKSKFILISIVFLSGITSMSSATIKRSNGYFGLHFDFHAVKENDHIGENVSKQMVQNIIENINPDYIQVDGKGHPGYSSYPTKIGHQTDGYIKDQLKIWRKVTKENNVPLVVHYSTLYDVAAISENPQWGYMKYDGSRDERFASLYSPIAKELIIPQIKELASEYDIDAVWFDGECWGVKKDYCPAAKREFKDKFGNDVKIPQNPDDELFFEYLEMLRQKFRDYAANYIKHIHSFDKDLEIASNWAYSSFMPEKCTLNVDWLSGDLSAYNSINAARLQARSLRCHKKNWDIMSWGFFHQANTGIFNTKTPIQLKQEAASVISQGGGFQIYNTQKPDGSVRKWQVENLVDVAKFCRARQSYCHHTKPVYQTAVLFSSDAIYHMGSRYQKVFGPWGDKETGGMAAVKGIVQALCESQIPFDLMMEHQITENLDQLELIIIPEWHWINEDIKNKLISFVKNGGNIIVIGPYSTKLFQKELDVSFNSEIQTGNRWLGFNNTYSCYMKNDFVCVEPQTSQKTIGTISTFEHTGYSFGADHTSLQTEKPAASIAELGNGKIAGIYLGFGRNYLLAGNCNSRSFLKTVITNLLPEPIVSVEGSNNVDVVVNRLNGNLAINLINTSGPHANNNIHVFDEIPSIGPLHVKIKTTKKPKTITLQPSNIKMQYSKQGTYYMVTIPELKLHQILIVK